MDNLDVTATSILRDGGVKCPRCRTCHYCIMNYDGLCDRCISVLLAEHQDHPSIQGIKASQQAQRDKYGIVVNSPYSGDDIADMTAGLDHKP